MNYKRLQVYFVVFQKWYSKGHALFFFIFDRKGRHKNLEKKLKACVDQFNKFSGTMLILYILIEVTSL